MCQLYINTYPCGHRVHDRSVRCTRATTSPHCYLPREFLIQADPEEECPTCDGVPQPGLSSRGDAYTRSRPSMSSNASGPRSESRPPQPSSSSHESNGYYPSSSRHGEQRHSRRSSGPDTRPPPRPNYGFPPLRTDGYRDGDSDPYAGLGGRGSGIPSFSVHTFGEGAQFVYASPLGMSGSMPPRGIPGGSSSQSHPASRESGAFPPYRGRGERDDGNEEVLPVRGRWHERGNMGTSYFVPEDDSDSDRPPGRYRYSGGGYGGSAPNGFGYGGFGPRRFGY